MLLLGAAGASASVIAAYYAANVQQGGFPKPLIGLLAIAGAVVLFNIAPERLFLGWLFTAALVQGLPANSWGHTLDLALYLAPALVLTVHTVARRGGQTPRRLVRLPARRLRAADPRLDGADDRSAADECVHDADGDLQERRARPAPLLLRRVPGRTSVDRDPRDARPADPGCARGGDGDRRVSDEVEPVGRQLLARQRQRHLALGRDAPEPGRARRLRGSRDGGGAGSARLGWAARAPPALQGRPRRRPARDRLHVHARTDLRRRPRRAAGRPAQGAYARLPRSR